MVPRALPPLPRRQWLQGQWLQGQPDNGSKNSAHDAPLDLEAEFRLQARLVFDDGPASGKASGKDRQDSERDRQDFLGGVSSTFIAPPYEPPPVPSPRTLLARPEAAPMAPRARAPRVMAPTTTAPSVARRDFSLTDDLRSLANATNLSLGENLPSDLSMIPDRDASEKPARITIKVPIKLQTPLPHAHEVPARC